MAKKTTKLEKFTKVSAVLHPVNVAFLKKALGTMGGSYSAMINDAVSGFRRFANGEKPW